MLSKAAATCGGRLIVTHHPRLVLHTRESVVPDFEIAANLPHVNSRYLVECQSRGRNSKSIVHKIQYVRSKSSRNKFIFVYDDGVSDATRDALAADGVLVCSSNEFALFIDRLVHTILATPPPQGGPNGGGGWDGGDEEEE